MAETAVFSKQKVPLFYINNAQLEKGYGTAPFNYIKNGCFNNSNENWSTATIVNETLNQESVKAVKFSGGLPSYNVGDGLDRPEKLAITGGTVKTVPYRGPIRRLLET